jgi:hypothetical protein
MKGKRMPTNAIIKGVLALVGGWAISAHGPRLKRTVHRRERVRGDVRSSSRTSPEVTAFRAANTVQSYPRIGERYPACTGSIAEIDADNTAYPSGRLGALYDC